MPRLSKGGGTLLKAIYRAWRDMNREISEAIDPENAKKRACLTIRLRSTFGGFTPGEH